MGMGISGNSHGNPTDSHMGWNDFKPMGIPMWVSVGFCEHLWVSVGFPVRFYGIS